MTGGGVFLKKAPGSSVAVCSNKGSSKVMYFKWLLRCFRVVVLPTCLAPVIKTEVYIFSSFSMVVSMFLLMYVISFTDYFNMYCYYRRIFYQSQLGPMKIKVFLKVQRLVVKGRCCYKVFQIFGTSTVLMPSFVLILGTLVVTYALY